MTETSVSTKPATETADAGTIDMKLEVVTIPVSDVDRAKAFYQNLGWRLDADFDLGGSPGGPVHAHPFGVLDRVRPGLHQAPSPAPSSAWSWSSPTSRRRGRT